MDRIIYTPYLKKRYVLIAVLTVGACCLYSCITLSTENSWLLLIIAGYCAAYAFSLNGSIVLDNQGLHVVYRRRGECAFVPWSSIHDCRRFPGGYGTPSICVLFQNPNYMVYGRHLKTTDDCIRISREGRKVLCDLSLQKLSFGIITPADFASRDVFGITVSEAEYKQICKWWTEWSPEITSN